jgi:hypothetical protein
VDPSPNSPFVIKIIKKSELWLIFAALKQGLNLEKSCQKKTPSDAASGASSGERIESRRAAADLEKSQARHGLSNPNRLTQNNVSCPGRPLRRRLL